MRDSPTNPWLGTPPSPNAAPRLYAGLLSRRCLGYFIDVLFISVIGICLGFALTILGILTLGLLSPLAAIILALWPLTYHSLFLALRGATPGMRVFGLEVRNWDGGPVSPLQAVIVTLLFYLSVSVTAWLILVVTLFNDRGRALHDILANTLVVRAQS